VSGVRDPKAMTPVGPGAGKVQGDVFGEANGNVIPTTGPRLPSTITEGNSTIGGVFKVPDMTPADRNAPPEVFKDLKAGANENMADFQAEDPSAQGPSDFVGFGRYAGINDDLMRQIADRNSSQSEKDRQAALGFLSDAEKEASAGVPVEQTASYKKYLDAMKKTSDAGKAFNAQTGNPYEDALRGVYSGAQTARENRLQANALNRSTTSANNRNRYNATQKQLADEAAAAAAAKQRADEIAEANAERAATKPDTADAIAKRKGATRDDEYTTRNRRAGSAGMDY
jgi:hypothetical protein